MNLLLHNNKYRHTCKISYLGLNGRRVSVAFGSSTPKELKRIRAVVRDVLKLVRKATKKHYSNTTSSTKKKMDHNMMVLENHDDDTTGAAGWISSSRSEVTALSNTVYGKNTTTMRPSSRRRF